MNKSNNKRYQITDEKIENALLTLLKDKDFNSIYVNDICKEAGIARTSFYSHYDDINDLILKIQKKYSNKIIDILLKNKLSPKDAYTKYFSYIKDHSSFYKAYFMSIDSKILAKTTYNSIFDLYSNPLNDDEIAKRKRKYHMIFIGNGIKSIACKWLFDGCIETPEEMTEILLQEYSYIFSNQNAENI